jgi:5-methylcytosine-specific restriction endonuclease McrA
MKPIKDEFSNRKISRQRRYQLRRQRDGLCTICGDLAAGGTSRCLKHLVKSREQGRKRLGLKRRWKNSQSYILQRRKKSLASL